MQVAMVSPYCLTRPGGVQGQVMGLARELARMGHRVSIIAPDDAFGRRRAAPEQQALVERLESQIDSVEFVGRSLSVRSNGSVAPITLSPLASVRTRELLNELGFEVAHFHEPMAPTVSYASLLRHEVATVGTFHRSGESGWYRALRPLARFAMERLDVRCAVSESARATAFAATGEECEVLFNGVEVSRFATATPVHADAPTVLFLGRHEERKGLGVLLEAFSKVCSSAELWIAGVGPETDDLRRRFPESQRLRWLGLLEDDQVASHVAGADVLCAPSLHGESFGMVLLEAMAGGCVVIASDLDGYRAAAGGHAVLVPPGDVDALAGALEGVLDEVASGTGRADPVVTRGALAHAQNWSMDNLAQRYVEIYERALAVHRA